jgi:hypothetical protein
MYLWNYVTDTCFEVEKVSVGFKVVGAAPADRFSIGAIFTDRQVQAGWWKILDHDPTK